MSTTGATDGTPMAPTAEATGTPAAATAPNRGAPATNGGGAAAATAPNGGGLTNAFQYELTELCADTLLFTTKKKAKNNLTDEMKQQIKNTIRGSLWRKWKFVNSDADETKFAKLVLENFGYAESKPTHPKNKQFVSNWMYRYSELCLRALNETRNYVQSRVRKEMLAYMDENACWQITQCSDHHFN